MIPPPPPPPRSRRRGTRHAAETTEEWSIKRWQAQTEPTRRLLIEVSETHAFKAAGVTSQPLSPALRLLSLELLPVAGRCSGWEGGKQ